MRITGLVRRVLASRGIVLQRRQSLRFGTDELLDVERLLARVETVVDVGANVGRLSLRFANAFPDARVYAFEPIPSTYASLVRATAREPRVTCFQLALGAQAGEATIRLKAKSGQHSLLDVAEPGPGTVGVDVVTGDAWAAGQGIDRIDVLKIDTEGYELQVLEGFDGLLEAGGIECVLAECELERVLPEPHTSFFDLYEHLTGRGMGFVSLYADAVWSGRFARGNALFVRDRS